MLTDCAVTDGFAPQLLVWGLKMKEAAGGTAALEQLFVLSQILTCAALGSRGAALQESVGMLSPS